MESKFIIHPALFVLADFLRSQFTLEVIHTSQSLILSILSHFSLTKVLLTLQSQSRHSGLDFQVSLIKQCTYLVLFELKQVSLHIVVFLSSLLKRDFLGITH